MVPYIDIFTLGLKYQVRKRALGIRAKFTLFVGPWTRSQIWDPQVAAVRTTMVSVVVTF